MAVWAGKPPEKVEKNKSSGEPGGTPSGFHGPQGTQTKGQGPRAKGQVVGVYKATGPRTKGQGPRNYQEFLQSSNESITTFPLDPSNSGVVV